MSRTPFHISSDCGNTRGRWLVGGTLQPPSFLPRSIKIGPFAGIRVRNGGGLLPLTPTGRPTPNPREVRGNPSEEWWKSILPLHRLLPPPQQQANAPIQTVTLHRYCRQHQRNSHQTLFWRLGECISLSVLGKESGRKEVGCLLQHLDEIRILIGDDPHRPGSRRGLVVFEKL